MGIEGEWLHDKSIKNFNKIISGKFPNLEKKNLSIQEQKGT